MIKELLILLIEGFVISCIVGYTVNKLIIIPICDTIRESSKDRTLMMIDIVDGYNKAKELIDSIISDSIQEYILLNPTIVMEGEYITLENENKIRDDIKALVIGKLSDNVLSILSTYYDNVSEVIAIRIYIAITDLVSANNTNDSNE